MIEGHDSARQLPEGHPALRSLNPLVSEWQWEAVRAAQQRVAPDPFRCASRAADPRAVSLATFD